MRGNMFIFKFHSLVSLLLISQNVICMALLLLWKQQLYGRFKASTVAAVALQDEHKLQKSFEVVLLVYADVRIWVENTFWSHKSVL